MRRIFTTVLAGLLMLAVVAPLFAWEFSMTGEFDIPLQVFRSHGKF